MLITSKAYFYVFQYASYLTSWNYWNCCKYHRNIIPDDVDTCPNPGSKEKRCVHCPADKLIVPVSIGSCNLTSQIPFQGSKIVLITLITYLQSLFTQPVAPEVP
ncbi:hypothetical protein B0O99DRAFT_630622 [Bisporella sp. PMI_857]|nr:hypothetical protein B0O99DRAFT_630622 [Bisporella sp. PMI_857]